MSARQIKIKNENTFCVAPWVHACVTPTGHLAPCCQWLGNSTHYYTDFDKWVNSETMQSVRESLDNGEKIDECRMCWTSEDAGATSTRQQYNNYFKNYFKNPEQYKINSSDIVTFDFKLGNLCNLKCVMCSGYSSSQLLTEYKLNKSKLTPIPGFLKPPLYIDFSWPLNNKFKEFLDNHKTDIQWLKFTGGEPTLIPYIIDLLDEIPFPEKVIIFITTNATTINERLLSVLSKFKRISISVSLEGIGEHNDQIRFLSSWKTIEKNIEFLKSLKNSKVTIHHMFQCFDVVTLVPLLKWCDTTQTNLSVTFIEKPEFLQINSVEPDKVETLKNNLLTLNLSINQHIINQILSALDNYKFDPELKIIRDKYISTIDEIRDSKVGNII